MVKKIRPAKAPAVKPARGVKSGFESYSFRRCMRFIKRWAGKKHGGAHFHLPRKLFKVPFPAFLYYHIFLEDKKDFIDFCADSS
jgi:hypothetical protein